jgi:DNA-binding MarR family transcriptional regulator
VVTDADESESDFHSTFQGAEDGFLAAFEEGMERLSEVVREAAGREELWLGRARAGLVALLGFLEDEPRWGRLLIVEASAPEMAARGCERRVHGVLAGLLSDGQGRRGRAIAGGEFVLSTTLVGELVLGGVFSVIRARMLDGGGGSLVELAPSLMSFIVVPYLGQDAPGVERAEPPAAMERVSAGAVAPGVVSEFEVASPLPFSYRTALVLRVIACAPRSSNREIAEAAGLADEGQTSHLLRRLARRGLIEKVTPRNGSRRENAWLLTHCGRRVIELLDSTAAAPPDASVRARVREAAQ